MGQCLVSNKSTIEGFQILSLQGGENIGLLNLSKLLYHTNIKSAYLVMNKPFLFLVHCRYHDQSNNFVKLFSLITSLAFYMKAVSSFLVLRHCLAASLFCNRFLRLSLPSLGSHCLINMVHYK